MRNLDIGFQNRLNSQVSSLAKCWIIIGKTGNEICITEHDEDIIAMGKTFKSANAFNATNLDLQNLPNSNRGAIEGAVAIDGISENDIILGKFDKAKIGLYLIDWQMPQYYVQIWQGIIGDIKLNGQVFEFELTGLESLLNKNLGRKFSRICDADFGDAKCTINIENYALSASVIEKISNSQIKVNFAISPVFENYKNGKLKFTNGAMQDTEFSIASIESTGSAFLINFKTQIAQFFNIGDAIKIYQSCDKNFATCKSRFNNAANFRGCPHMPGESIIYASP